jgi:hypothetical protein
MNEAKEDAEHRRQKREDELRRVPPTQIDEASWPRNVRQISLEETGGLGIDDTGRLYWNGKPVEIVSQRLDLTWAQFVIAVVVAAATVVAALATAVQAWTAYNDWACKTGWPAICDTSRRSLSGRFSKELSRNDSVEMFIASL